MKLLAVLIIVVVCVNAIELDYGIIIDCGSTGSRIYLYEWPHRDINTLPLVEPASINQTVVSKNINVPLASFDGNASFAGASLEPLIVYIKQYLTQSKWNSTPIYLKATAGMRALPQESQDEIISSARAFLATTPFLFAQDYAQVIPGYDEGFFGWVTVNYALQLLTLSNPTTWGALDLGGASTQITFAPQAAPKNDSVNAAIAGNTFNLYAYSYPLGQDAALALLNNALVSNNINDGYGNIVNPCYLRGYNESYSATVLLVGTGNQTLCNKFVELYLINKDPSCTQCGLGSNYQPPVNGRFWAFSGYAYTYEFFGLPNTTTLAGLAAVGATFCSMSWNDALTQYPNEGAAYLKNYCYTSTYIGALLSAYGFASDSVDVVAASSIGNIQITYALGAMIYEASLLPLGPINVTTSTTTSSTTATSSSPITNEGSCIAYSMVLCMFTLTILLLWV